MNPGFTPPDPIDLGRIRVRPLASRASLRQLLDLAVDPSAEPPPLTDAAARAAAECAGRIRAARERGAAVILLCGAHLIRNGAQRILARLLQDRSLTHLATNGAGAIHDWEFSFLGRTTESVRANVADGTFGTWDETGTMFNLAALAGGPLALGLGEAVARFILEDGVDLPEPHDLAHAIRERPDDPLTAARADLLRAMREHAIPPGPHRFRHAHADLSALANALRAGFFPTIHPGIGYDIISNHPLFHGAAIGRAATIDFRRFAAAVDSLDSGVVLSIGSAIMGPQIFEKSLSCVHNLRAREGRGPVRDHAIYVVDLQDGGGWDWTSGEPPKENPAYYLRFCKSYSRMGGLMRYVQCDNVAFLHHLHRHLANP